MLTAIKTSAQWIAQRSSLNPRTAIILGTGLGRLAEEIDIVHRFAYEEIPHFPLSTVEGHSGALLIGRLGGCEILAMQGRFHYYEGYDMRQVTYPVRVMHELGIQQLFVSNAAGGLLPTQHIGELMFITDHINHFPQHPLRGANFPTGPRFPDMSEAYDRELLSIARSAAKDLGIAHSEGVYVGTQGPTFETPAEYRMFRLLGGSAVGMSTVPEVIVARHCGIRCFGVSIITDLGVEGKIEKVSHEEVQKAADAVQPQMAAIMRELLLRSQ